MSEISTTPSVRLVAPSAIRVAEGANPRRTFDPEAVARLAASVALHGVLQPLLVRADPEDPERLLLIAGERRLRAARAAGMDQVPVLVRGEGPGEDLHLALIENLQRAEMSPIEEAEAFQKALAGRLSQRRLADVLGVSASLVRERLALLRLPAPIRELIGAGAVPVSLGALLRQIAAVSEPVALACARAVGRGAVVAADLERRPEDVLRRLDQLAGEGEPAPFIVAAGGWSHVGLEQVLAHVEAPELVALAAELEANGTPLRDEDVEAGRAFGCLLEFRHDRYERAQFLCDPAFVADRMLLRLRAIAERRAQASVVTATAGRESGDAPSEEDAEAARRAEREDKRRARAAAVAANADLGVRLAEAFHRPAFSAEVARLLALLVIDRDAAGLAARGLRYTRPDWQQVERRTLASGETREKIAYPPPHEAEARLREWIAGARAPEEILGRLLQALLAAAYADQQAVAQSQRAYYSFRGGASWKEVLALIDTLGAEIVPQRLGEAFRAERGEWVARAAELPESRDQDDGAPTPGAPMGSLEDDEEALAA
jgi:ParB family chromosome partitioning protein